MKKNTINILKRAKWYPNRKIDITQLSLSYEKKGFEIFPTARKFIEEYGMLNIYLPKIRYGVSKEYIEKYELTKFTLHSTDVTNSIVNGLMSRSYVEEYESYIEEKLVVVGSLTDGHQYLMISESGKLFTENGFYGNNPEEFWDRLINYENITFWVEWDG